VIIIHYAMTPQQQGGNTEGATESLILKENAYITVFVRVDSLRGVGVNHLG